MRPKKEKGQSLSVGCAPAAVQLPRQHAADSSIQLGGGLGAVQHILETLMAPGTDAAVRGVFRGENDQLRMDLLQGGTLERLLGPDWASAISNERPPIAQCRDERIDRGALRSNGALAAALAHDEDYERIFDHQPHDEDTAQMAVMAEKLDRLPIELLRRCVAPWRDPNADSESGPQLCSTVVETVRYLAAVHLLTIADKFQCLPGAEERINLINNMMMSLWEGIGLLQPKIRDHVALLLGVQVPATAHDICVAVSALGITTFFSALPLHDLRDVCHQLGILDESMRGIDEDLLSDLYCRRLCTYFYPSHQVVPEAEKCCAVQTAVQENAPGSYTCTISNACLLSMIGQRTHVSNLFTCNKTKWRARVHVHMDSYLSFSVIQRQHPKVRATMILRSVSESRAKKSATAATTTGSGQPLRLEKTIECTKDSGIGFEHIVSVMEVINGMGEAPKGLYNSIEDKLVFHFTLATEIIEAGELSAAAPEVSRSQPPSVGRPIAASGEAKLKPGMTRAQRAAALGAEEPAAAAPPPKSPVSPESRVTPGSGDATAESNKSKKRKEFEKKRKVLEQQETSGRDKIQAAATATLSSILSDAAKGKQAALQQQKDRERRQELSKAQPNHELQAQLNTLQQNVIQARKNVAKLQQEKAALEKDIAKQLQVIANRKKDVEIVSERLATTRAAIATADSLNADLEVERDGLAVQLDKAKEEERQAKQLKDLLTATTASEAPQKSCAVIEDYKTFWQSKENGNPSSASSLSGCSSAAQSGMPSLSSTSPQSSSSVHGNGLAYNAPCFFPSNNPPIGASAFPPFNTGVSCGFMPPPPPSAFAHHGGGIHAQPLPQHFSHMHAAPSGGPHMIHAPMRLNPYNGSPYAPWGP